MAHDDLLDVARVDVDAAGDDHVLLPIHQVEKAILVEIAQVARVEPAVADGQCRQVGALVVARHEHGAAADDLAHLARRHVVAGLVDDAHLLEGRRHADRGQLARRIRLVEDGHEALGQPVEFVEAIRQTPLQLFLLLLEQRRAHGAETLERAARLLAKVRLVQQRHDLRRHHVDVRDPLAPDRLDEQLRVEVIQQHVGAAEKHPRHEREHRPVEDNRAGVTDDALRRHAPGACKERAVIHAHVVGVDDALGQPGRTAAVEDVVRVVAVDEHIVDVGFARRRGKRVKGSIAGKVIAAGDDVAIAGHQWQFATQRI